MEIRSILVHLDQLEQTPGRVALAADLARRHEAHLIGLAPTGWATAPIDITGTMGAYVEEALQALREQAQECVRRFEAQAVALGVASYEGRVDTDDVAVSMTLAARYCDLAVVTQTEPGRWAAARQAGMPESVLLHSGRPLLVLPFASAPATMAQGGRVLVAWDGGREAARAMCDALPLLRRAGTVDVVVFETPSSDPTDHGPLPGADIGLWLARHGIRVNVSRVRTDIAVGEALLSHAADIDAQLIVAGGYGHARVRETVLGGVTRTLLRSATVPVLLSH